MKTKFYLLFLLVFIPFVKNLAQTNATTILSGFDYTIKSGYFQSSPSQIVVDGDGSFGGSILLQSENGSSGSGNITLNANGPASNIYFKTQNTTKMTLKSNGYLGIGTINPEFSLHINSDRALLFERTSWGPYKATISISTYSGVYGLRFAVYPDGNLSNSVDVLHLGMNGNVGIGTTNPTSKLTVNGEVLCEKVRCIADVPYADYVFDNDYKLLPIEDLNQFIKINRHLPEIPTAKEVDKSGINLMEMNILLLKKIEEQTLYIIEMNERIISLEKQVLEINQ